MSSATSATERARALLRANWRYAVVAAVGLAMYLLGLGDPVLYRWDEAFYANAARYMVTEGHWLTPHVRAGFVGGDLALSPRLQKPPLVYWLEALSMLVFGVTTFAARLPSALAAVGTALLAVAVGRRVFDDRTGLAAGLVLLALPPVYVNSHSGRTGEPDMLLTLFGSVFLWCVWRARNDADYLLPGAVAAGLAVMAKGFNAGVFVIVAAPVVARWPRAYLNRRGIRAVGATLLVALPWPLYAYARHGDFFVQEFVVRSVLERVQGNSYTPPQEPVFGFMSYPYVKEFPRFLSPVFVALLLAGLALLAWRWRRDGVRAHRDAAFLAWWALAVPVTFSVLGGNHIWYLLPMVVPVAVVVGHLLATAYGRVAGRVERGVAASPLSGRAWVALGVVALVVLSVPYPAFTNQNGPDIDQQRVGVAVDDRAPDGATVYVDAELRRVQVLSFYLRHPMARADAERLAGDAAVEYAVVSSETLASVDREHTVVARGTASNVTAVRFESGNATG